MRISDWSSDVCSSDLDRDIRKWWKDVVKYPRGTFSARRILSLVARTEMDRGTMAGMRYRIDAAEKRAATAEEQVRDAQAKLVFWFDQRELAPDQVESGGRSEARRVGEEGDSKCRSGGTQ